MWAEEHIQTSDSFHFLPAHDLTFSQGLVDNWDEFQFLRSINTALQTPRNMLDLTKAHMTILFPSSPC